MTSLGGRIDVHQHFLPQEYVTTLGHRAIDNAGGRALPSWSLDGALSLMDANDIELSVVSISAPGVWLGDDMEARRLARSTNAFAAELSKDRPDRFGFFASLPLPDIEASLKEIAHAYDVLGADGVVLLTNVAGRYLGDPYLEPVYEELNRRRAVVLIHPTAPASKPVLPISDFTLEFVFDTTRALVNLAYQGVLYRYPGIRFIASHAGGTLPFLATRVHRGWWSRPEAMAAAPEGPLGDLRRVYYDTALSVSPETLSCLIEFAGADHVLFGSDFPFAKPDAVADQVKHVDQYLATQSTAVRDSLLRDNAVTLFDHVERRLAPTAVGARLLS